MSVPAPAAPESSRPTPAAASAGGAADASAAAPPTEIAACPLCGATGAPTVVPKLFDAVWAKPGTFALARCPGCSLAFLSPRPPRDRIGFYYEGLYDGDGLKAEEALQHSAIAGFLNGLRLRALFSRRRPAPGERHLDVGCGVGALLLKVARTTGASVIGIDVSPSACEAAARRARGAGLPVEIERGFFADATIAPGELATVSMIHFLEHSYDPAGELALAFRALEPGGAIVVEVPSFDSLARHVFGPYWFPYLVPQHVTLFSKTTLARALEDAGFQDVRVADSFAPLVWLASFILWYHTHLGGRSRYGKSIPMRLFTLLFSIVSVPTLLVFDLIVSLILPRLGRGEHIRATAIKPGP